MERITGKVLKSEEVHLEGQFHLDMTHEELMSSQNRRNVMAVPQVHIQENNFEYSVIKVICSCGQEITLKCEY